MARITLSIADDVAAQLDAYAAESNLNRSQAAEFILRKFFTSEAAEPASTGNDGDTAQQLAEIKDYLTLFHGALAGFTDTEAVTLRLQLPEPPWEKDQVSYIGRSLRRRAPKR